VRDEDEIIRAYERELDGIAEPARRSNRGFWLVAGSLAAACVFVVIEILANGPIKDTIAHAEATLRSAEATAGAVRAHAGSYGSVDVAAMSAGDGAHSYRAGDAPSTGLDDVSIATADGEWAAAVQARPEACFYLRLTDAGDVFYGVGTVCTGETALGASDPRW
jgi:hypothetical protein